MQCLTLATDRQVKVPVLSSHGQPRRTGPVCVMMNDTQVWSIRWKGLHAADPACSVTKHSWKKNHNPMHIVVNHIYIYHYSPFSSRFMWFSKSAQEQKMVLDMKSNQQPISKSPRLRTKHNIINNTVWQNYVKNIHMYTQSHVCKCTKHTHVCTKMCSKLSEAEVTQNCSSVKLSAFLKTL